MELAAVNSPAAAFVAGLITSIHCAGMCGPLACSLMPIRSANSTVRADDPQLIATAYHLSRLLGYATLGAIGGAIGRMPLAWVSASGVQWAPWILVGFFIALAMRWDRYLPKVVFLGRLTRQLQTWTRGRSRVVAASAMGLGTPLLPCGPLYFILSLALLSGSAVRGVEFMLAFGLGTVPLLWLAQSQFHWLRQKFSPRGLDRARMVLALVTAVVVAWRLRSTLGLPGPDPSTFVCH
jgi:sulfite exporter TauE/SafE